MYGAVPYQRTVLDTLKEIKRKRGYLVVLIKKNKKKEQHKQIHRNSGHNVVIAVVFTSNRSFYPTTSSAVHPVSVLILHPREIRLVWSQTVKQRNTKTKQWRITEVGKSNA